MLAFPIFTAVVLAILTVSVLGRHQRRPQQIAWGVALAWGLVATLAYIGSGLLGGVPSLFRIYYLGGAMLSAPLLGVGSCYLLPGRFWARVMLAVTVVGGALAAFGLWIAPLSVSALAGMGIGPGTGAVHSPLVLVPIIVGNSLGTLAVVGVAVWSLIRAFRGLAPWRIGRGNVLIAGGTLMIAAAGSLARLGHGAGFWGTMAVGWAVLCGGVLTMTTRVEARHQSLS